MGKRRKTIEPVSDWTALPRDILVDIRNLVLKSGCAEDFMSFGGVCSSWRAVTKDDECLSSLKLLPFLMLADKEGSRGFYSLSKGKVCMRLPMSGGERCIESRFGWFLIQTSKRVDLLNPFTGLRIPLPEYTAFPHKPYRDRGIIKQSVLSANPSSHISNYVLVVLTDLCLAYWKPGNKNWTKIDMDNSGILYTLLYSNRDKMFYSIDNVCRLWVWDAARARADSGRAKRLFQFDVDYGQKSYSDKYLVESSDGELLLVTRDSTLTTVEFRVYQMDVAGCRCADRVTSLKDAILVGHNAAFCLVPPTDSRDIIQSNSIYFTGILFYKHEIVKGMGIYSLKDGSIQRFRQPVENFSFIGPPLWVAPSSLSLR